MDKAWKRLSETHEQKISWRTVVTKTFKLPDGSTDTYGTYTPEGTKLVAVLGLTPANEVVIARQYRPGPEMFMDELPGGAVETEDSDVAAAAKREFREETGYRVGSLEPLGVARNAYSNAVHYYFLARDCVADGQQQLDHGEFVEVRLITIEQLLANAKEGLLSDPVAVLMAHDHLMRQAAQ